MVVRSFNPVHARHSYTILCLQFNEMSGLGMLTYRLRERSFEVAPGQQFEFPNDVELDVGFDPPVPVGAAPVLLRTPDRTPRTSLVPLTMPFPPSSMSISWTRRSPATPRVRLGSVPFHW
jgi:hypothetical protein